MRSVFILLCVLQVNKRNVTNILHSPTIDQSLWWKSLEIQHSESSKKDINDIVLRLGGLHTALSFLGAIGQLMGGTGLQELLEVVYADTAVSHILTSKAISQPIHEHILIDAALYAIILSKMYKFLPLPYKGKEREEKNKEQIREKTFKYSVVYNKDRNQLKSNKCSFSFVMSNCEVLTLPLVSWVRCGT